jgi:hypothetical protein
MSAFGSKADIAISLRHVRLWPKADIHVLFDYLVGKFTKLAPAPGPAFW